ncbi:MAG: hypothetical protein WBA43_04430 [Elainellaceae cyanobacterium]
MDTNVDTASNIHVHLPSGEVSPLTTVIETSPHTLDFNLIYFHNIINSFISLNTDYRSYHFLITRRVDQLPDLSSSTLKKMIVFSLGDEWCRVPSYAPNVLAVFKCYGSNLNLSFHKTDLYLNSVILFQHLRIACNNLMRRRVSKGNVYPIPLGYYRQLDLPIKAISERTCDVFFAGSIKNSSKATLLAKIKSLLRSPKTISRLSMISCISQWENTENYTIDVSQTARFPHADESSELLDYSEKLMNAKICLAPRGTSLETFRYFESLRYGCILISEPVPKHWFYEDSPAIYLDNWNDLPAVIENLLSDEKRLLDLHHKALDWWQNYCSPRAVALSMERFLLQISKTS